MMDGINLGADRAARSERRWAFVSIGICTLLVVMAAYAGIHQATMPQSRVETVDPRTLHLAGEFIESNLGSELRPDGSVMVRAIGQQYSFMPPCIVVPAGAPITFRLTSADVLHGFMVDGTTVNAMLVPGYVSTIPVRFAAAGERHIPCHEFCGVGHQGMWGRIKIVEPAAFRQMAATSRRLSCAE
jgi:cytochrome c oxidase subunit 2